MARSAGDRPTPVETLYVVVRRDTVPDQSFLTLGEAAREMLELLTDEPGASGDVWIETVSLAGERPSD